MSIAGISVTAVFPTKQELYACRDVGVAKGLASEMAPKGKKIIWSKVVGSWNNWVGTIDNYVFCIINTEFHMLGFYFIIGFGPVDPE